MRLGLVRKAALVLAVVLASGGCAGRWSYRQGIEAGRKADWDLAVARLTRALQEQPDNIDYKMALENAKIQASRAHHHNAQKHLAANNLEAALEELDVAAKFDPSNQAFALDRKLTREKIERLEDERRQRTKFEEMKRRADASRAPVTTLSPRSPIPISLHMPDASLQKVFDTLAQLAGVNILFDELFRDKQVNVKLVDVTFQEALDQLTFVNGFFYKVLDANTIIIAPENPQKRRRYEENLMRTFYLQNADPNELLNNVRQMLTATGAPPRMVASPALRTITVMGNADEIALAARIVDALDKPIGEVLVEVEILDVNKTKAKDYGISLANHSASVTLSPFNNDAKDPVSLRAHLLSSFNLSDFVVNIPSTILVNFLQKENTSRILASPRLRAAEGKQTILRIGTEVPIPITSFIAQTGGVNNIGAPATSIQYRNVGINMELTPRVNAEGEVTFDPLAAEFSLIGGDRNVGGTLAPTFLTRNVRGTLRVKDGETALIGGLIQSTETEQFAGFIGIQNVPILNRLLTNHTPSHDESEILISITPHVVRGPKLSDEDMKSLYTGTKEIVKVPGSRPPLFGPIEEPTETPTPAPPVAPTTPPVGVAPPPPVVPVDPNATPVPGGGAPVPGGMAATGLTPLTPAAEGVSEEPSVTVIFSPPETPIKLGETASVSVVVIKVRDLVSVELGVSYDPASVSAESVDPGSLLTLDGAAVSSERNLEPGRIRGRFARTTPTSAGGSTGAVVSMTFKGLKPGPSTITIDSLSLITPRGRERVTLPGPGRVVVLP
jgi:general secretion pathway protein D